MNLNKINISNNIPMKIYILFLLFFLLFNDIYSQSWKNYPYIPENSLISFPKDEGRHINEPTEWWYVFSHLKGEETGNDYTVMLTFFYRDTLSFDGLRIFNITNETTGDFFPNASPVIYIVNSEEHLEIKANLFTHTETWTTKTDNQGILIPFQYNLKAHSPSTAIDLDMNVIKKPLILADTGFLYQGINNYTYYYSFTGMEISGSITIPGITENVSGTGWFDKQYGNFHPEVGEKYEWFSIQLSNGMDINTWNIFTTDNLLPDSSIYKSFNCYINDSSFHNTSNFKIEHLGYFYSPDSSRIYGRKFRIVEELLKMNLIIEIQNPNCEPQIPFPFYEGPIKIEGLVNGKHVDGKGFAELLHIYEFPDIEIIAPSEGWDFNTPVKWTLHNYDEGRPLAYNILTQKEGIGEYIPLITGLTDTFYNLKVDDLAYDTLYRFMITAYSVDTFLVDTVYTNEVFKPNAINNINNKLDLIISPNPFDNEILISTNNNHLKRGTNILLITEEGKKVYSKSIYEKLTKIRINTSDFKKGIYILVVTKGNSIYIKKLIKIN